MERGYEFIHPEIIAIENRQRAYNPCKDIDIKDVLAVALSSEITVKKMLKESLLKQGFKQIFAY